MATTATKKKSESNGEHTVRIDVPLAEPGPDTYVGKHVEARLTAEQGEILNYLFTALHGQGATLRSKRHVDTRADAVRWLLERVGAVMAREQRAKSRE